MKIQNDMQYLGFGQLIITPEARVAIKRCRNVQTLEKLLQAKTDMENTEFFDIVIGKDLKCKLRSLKEAFFGVFESSKYSNIRNGVNEDILELGEYSISRHPLYKNDEELGYSIWKTEELGDIENAEHIDTLVEIAQELDKQAIKHESRSLPYEVNAVMAKKLQQKLLNN